MDEIQGYQVFYMKKTGEGKIKENRDGVRLDFVLESKIIPANLKEAFLKEFQFKIDVNAVSLTEEEINEFLKNN